MPTFKRSLLLLFVMIAVAGFSQKKGHADSTTFKIQIDYLNNYIYNGRADSLPYPYQITTATVNFANGLYASFSADYLLAQNEQRFDFSELDLGYAYSIGEKLSGEIYGSKYFYNSQAALLNGNISTDLGASVNYDLGFIQFNNTFDVFFSNKSDFQWTTGFEKSLSFSDKKGEWNITPSLYANISSINFYESEVTRKVGIKNAKGKIPPNTGILSTTKVNDLGTKLMAIELGLPISYELEHFGFSFSPVFAMPFNKVTTTTTNINSTTNALINTVNSTPYSELNLANRFYFQAGIYYKF